MLLAAGADKDSRDRQGITPLHSAIARHHEALVQVLLLLGLTKKPGATLNIQQPYYTRQLNKATRQWCSYFWLQELTEARQYQQFTALHLAAGEGHEAVLQVLLAAGANKQARGEQHHGYYMRITHNARRPLMRALCAHYAFYARITPQTLSGPSKYPRHYCVIRSGRYWEKVDDFLMLMKPLVIALRHADGDKPISKIYPLVREAVQQARTILSHRLQARRSIVDFLEQRLGEHFEDEGEGGRTVSICNYDVYRASFCRISAGTRLHEATPVPVPRRCVWRRVLPITTLSQ